MEVWASPWDDGAGHASDIPEVTIPRAETTNTRTGDNAFVGLGADTFKQDEFPQQPLWHTTLVTETWDRPDDNGDTESDTTVHQLGELGTNTRPSQDDELFVSGFEQESGSKYDGAIGDIWKSNVQEEVNIPRPEDSHPAATAMPIIGESVIATKPLQGPVRLSTEREREDRPSRAATREYAKSLDLSQISNLLPKLKEDSELPSLESSLVNSTESRQIWYRISRTETLLKHKSGNEHYVHVTWQKSQTRVKVTEIVAGWGNRSRYPSDGHASMESRLGAVFGWGQKAAEKEKKPDVTKLHALLLKPPGSPLPSPKFPAEVIRPPKQQHQRVLPSLSAQRPLNDGSFTPPPSASIPVQSRALHIAPLPLHSHQRKEVLTPAPSAMPTPSLPITTAPTPSLSIFSQGSERSRRSSQTSFSSSPVLSFNPESIKPNFEELHVVANVVAEADEWGEFGEFEGQEEEPNAAEEYQEGDDWNWGSKPSPENPAPVTKRTSPVPVAALPSSVIELAPTLEPSSTPNMALQDLSFFHTISPSPSTIPAVENLSTPAFSDSTTSTSTLAYQPSLPYDTISKSTNSSASSASSKKFSEQALVNSSTQSKSTYELDLEAMINALPDLSYMLR
jgi:hypothetical protein